jgi:hypothetical protein
MASPVEGDLFTCIGASEEEPKKHAKVRQATRTEKEVLAQVLDAARCLGLDLNRQNTGAAVNPRGKLVCFGQKGNSDLTGVLPDGRAIHVELKREGFDPHKARGEERERFERQLARLQKTNALGGIGFWTDDAAEFLEIMRIVLDGGRVEEPGYGRPVVYRRMEEKPF